MKWDFYLRLLSTISVVGLLSVQACAAPPQSPTPTAQQPAYWPGDEWRTSTPEEQGIDSAMILAMLQEIRQNALHVHSFLVIRHGYLVTEVYFPPYSQELKHPLYSITKSVTSAMTGVAIKDGHIEGVQQHVLDFFPEIAEETKDERLKELTIEHLLTMSGGFNADTLPDLSNPNANCDAVQYILTHSNLRCEPDANFDTAKYILTHRKIQHQPGEAFFYDSGMPHVLSAILQETSGMTLEGYTKKNLFDPLGIKDFRWQSDPQGITMGHSGLSLRPREMAKLGYLYLHNGQWNGRQIIPAEWIQVSMTKHMETKGVMNTGEDDGYGYYWWMDSLDGYFADGFGGQYLFVMPRLDMIVVFTGGFSDPDFPTPHRLLKTYLLPAAQPTEALAANPQAFDQLKAEITDIQNPEKAVAALPEIARQISGREIRITGAAAAGWLEKIRFTFPGGDMYMLELVGPENTLLLTGGLNNLFQLNMLGPERKTIFPLRGYWQDDHTFIEEQNFNLTFDHQFFTVTYTFEGTKVLIKIDSSQGIPPFQVIGEIIE